MFTVTPPTSSNHGGYKSAPLFTTFYLIMGWVTLNLYTLDFTSFVLCYIRFNYWSKLSKY